MSEILGRVHLEHEGQADEVLAESLEQKAATGNVPDSDFKDVQDETNLEEFLGEFPDNINFIRPT